MAESEEKLDIILMKVKEKSGKTGLKLNIKKTAFKHTQQVWLSLLWDHCSSLLGPGVHKILFVPSKSLCFP